MKSKSKIIKIISLSFAGFIGLFLITTMLVVFVFPYLSFPNNKKKYPDWMKDVDGNQLITDIVLPGTHDSTTNICDLPYFTKTQNTSIEEQLNIGVRTFDMRLALEGEKLKFVHSSFNCKENIFKTLYLDKICNLMYDFLDKNPSETILFIAKNENVNDSVSKLGELFEESIKDKKDYWYLIDSVPSLDKVRGKIVLLTRYESNIGMGLFWRDQGNTDNTSLSYDLISNGDYNVFVQDRYKYNKEEKWAAFTSWRDDIPEKTFVLNYLSTTEGGLTSPRPIASNLNKKFMKYDIPSCFKGSIMLDYINSDLVEKIINAN